LQASESCGIIGIFSSRQCSIDIFYGLRALQHRGQESAGIATFHEDSVHRILGPGLVHNAFTRDQVRNLNGARGIGHVRYPTTGGADPRNIQPLVVSSLAGDVALAHNGDIVNSSDLRNELHGKGWSFLSRSDSEIIVRIIIHEMSRSNGDPVLGIQKAMDRLVGSYALVMLVGDRVFTVRDPHGIKPLCLGQLSPFGLVVASESCALDVLGARFLRDVAPGEVLELTAERAVSHSVRASPNTAHCMFEYVYFSRPDSVLDGRSVYKARTEMGRALAREFPVEADVVVPVPDSGRAHALGFSEVSGIPMREGLIKNRYVHRTFIMGESEKRKRAMSLKLTPNRAVIQGKRVVLLDDSIVRGTTMGQIVQMLRKAGAMEVHVRIGSPPILSPCYYGIDMKTRDQFIAKPNQKREAICAKVAKSINANTVGYVTVEGLVRAIGKSEDDMCLGCLARGYPTSVPKERTRKLRGK